MKKNLGREAQQSITGAWRLRGSNLFIAVSSSSIDGIQGHDVRSGRVEAPGTATYNVQGDERRGRVWVSEVQSRRSVVNLNLLSDIISLCTRDRRVCLQDAGSGVVDAN